MTISVPRGLHETAGQQRPAGAEIALEDELVGTGERVSISELLVVAPVWGRLRKRPVTEGQALEEGSIIGFVQEDGARFPLVCHGTSVFVSWLVRENERVPPGRAIARLRSAEQ